MSPLRAVRAAAATICRRGWSRTPSSRRRSTPPTSGSAPHGHRAAAFRGRGELTSRAGPPRRGRALADGGLTGADALIVATATPDQTFPSVAVKVQSAIGMRGGFAFDLQAVCAGFVFALAQADAMIRGGAARRVMVIGAETFSRILDFQDRSTCAVRRRRRGAIFEAAEGTGTAADRGILATDLHSDGRYGELLYVDGGPSSTGTAGVVRMAGRKSSSTRSSSSPRPGRRRSSARGSRPPTSTGWCRTRRTCGS